MPSPSKSNLTLPAGGGNIAFVVLLVENKPNPEINLSPIEDKNTVAGLTTFADSNPSGFEGFVKNPETSEIEFDKIIAKPENAEFGFETENGSGGAVTGSGSVFADICFSALTIEKLPTKITGNKNANMSNSDKTRNAFETVKKDRRGFRTTNELLFGKRDGIIFYSFLVEKVLLKLRGNCFTTLLGKPRIKKYRL